MDDLLNWIRSNLKIVIFSLVGIVIFSITIGLFIGLVSRQKWSYNSKLSEQKIKLEQLTARQRESVIDKDKNLFLMPPAVKIKLSDIQDISSIDELSYLLDSLKLKPIKLSDLINTRTMGEGTSIKPIIFNNEEKSIITLKDEIIEP